ncbi:uncharacterized protein LOC115770246 [Drosophila novamexicana]|uniref:uncharacterized protein LOC115770246 n=1 Tax=Drosophila novamexicana TaxID=47314 RepID=UPI0011E5E99C|nr:uncharacterized protein LOC115770246 [Drosophila novamexicana]
MIGENIQHGNTVEYAEKRSSTGAVVNLKKLLRTVTRIFNLSKPKNMATDETGIKSSAFATEEELQNWLNEQLELKEMSLR